MSRSELWIFHRYWLVKFIVLYIEAPAIRFPTILAAWMPVFEVLNLIDALYNCIGWWIQYYAKASTGARISAHRPVNYTHSKCNLDKLAVLLLY